MAICYSRIANSARPPGRPPPAAPTVAFAHFEADECGALNDFLAAAPHVVPVASQVGAMVSVNAFADRPARAMADGEILRTGRRAFKWLDAPHVPHGWDNGYLMELETRTMFSGDLFT